MASTDILFQPFTSPKLTLKNRIVMAPMTRNMAPEGVPGLANAEYYARRAAGEVGLILSEGTVVDRPASRNLPNIPFFHGDAALAGWRQVAEAVHVAGEHMARAVDALRAAGEAAPTHWADVAALAPAMADRVVDAEPAVRSVLVKGSRFMRMERVVQALQVRASQMALANDSKDSSHAA